MVLCTVKTLRFFFQNDKMYNSICNILVTELPMREQKKVIFMTSIAQHPFNLTIGGFQLLNVETFVFVSIPVNWCFSHLLHLSMLSVLVNEKYVLRWYAFSQHTVEVKYSFTNSQR